MINSFPGEVVLKMSFRTIYYSCDGAIFYLAQMDEHQ